MDSAKLGSSWTCCGKDEMVKRSVARLGILVLHGRTYVVVVVVVVVGSPGLVVFYGDVIILFFVMVALLMKLWLRFFPLTISTIIIWYNDKCTTKTNKTVDVGWNGIVW